MTCRITTDRPETVFGARSNILVPPASKDIIVDMIKYITKNDSLRKKMESQKSLYGNNVGKKFISIVLKLMGKNDKPFKWAHDTLKLWSDNEKGIDYL
jgi:UDP-N-acetylglucosamine 2-epimerase (non-hydrolysing)